eukprot:TRINITY_DN2331_c0_g1_i1.p2 TRINITY_DN2331_c0_g1~~TRINITY_DN2331_c0_g1_i1.p2  ORF type:complete len:114 (+),score=17.94 TRINITY_DN2331_c0_g1_i1:91-432(+)
MAGAPPTLEGNVSAGAYSGNPWAGYKANGPYWIVRGKNYNPNGNMWVAHVHGPDYNFMELTGTPSAAVMTKLLPGLFSQAPPGMLGVGGNNGTPPLQPQPSTSLRKALQPKKG